MKKEVIFMIAVGFAAGTAMAADTTWDGDGDANTGGSWNTPANWDTDAEPTTGDNAFLPTVTDGSTRTVTVDSSAAVDQLHMDQDGATGVNRLSLGAGLTINTTQLDFGYSGGATAAQVQIDFNGNELSTTGTSLTYDAGTFNLNAPGSYLYNRQISNGHWTFNIDSTVNTSSADTRLLHAAAGSYQHTGNGTINLRADSSVNVTSGDLTLGSIRLSGAAGQSRNLNINNSGTITTAAGGTLEMTTKAVSHYGGAQRILNFNNNANVHQAGTMQFRSSSNGTSGSTGGVTLNNNNSWVLSGTSSVLKRMTTLNDGSNIVIPVFNNNSGGILRGDSAADTVEYDEEVNTGTRMTIYNDGTIQAGAGSQGSGTSSVGILTFKDIDLVNNGTLELDLGGKDAGQYDQLLLATGDMDPLGAGTLTAGGTLQLWTVNGFSPSENFSINLIEAGSVSGTFSTVMLDGDTFIGNELDVGGGFKYQLGYEADAVTLAYIPEPGTVTLLLIGLFSVILSLRRR